MTARTKGKQTSKTGKVGRPEGTSREAILQAALLLLNEGGESALSFRKLATKLNVTAPSLYSYFKNKQELIAALGEKLFDADALTVNSKLPADKQLAKLLNQLRQQLLQQPGLVALFNTALPANTMIKVMNVLAAPMLQAGMSKTKAIRHAQSLLWMVLGFTLFEEQSKEDHIINQFIEADPELIDTVKYLDLNDHEKLWKETLERNITGTFS